MAKEVKEEEMVEAPAVEMRPPAAEPLLSFEAWFRSTGNPPHHMAGMRTAANTTYKRKKSEWDLLFLNY